MSESIGDKPAFAQHGWSNDKKTIERMGKNGGMNYREWLIGQAFQGLMANYEAQKKICNSDPRYRLQSDGEYNFKDVVALNCAEFADAIIALLDKKGEK